MANSFVGTWETNWGSFDTGPHDGLTVTVTESFRTDPDGNVLDGMYDAPNRHPGTMHGDLSGNTWTGTWMNSPTEKGTFTFTLGEGDSFTGTYTADGREGEKPWNSTRLKRRHTDEPAK
jgi:hypothetical protein